MAITASYNSVAKRLTITGDTLSNSIVISRNAAGTIFVNGGAVAISGGTPTVANTLQIDVFALDGIDAVSLDETAGPLPAAFLFGGIGADALTGGSAGDQLQGGDDADILNGQGGADFLFGGGASDTLTGGTGDDQMFGESGADRMIWNPGDGNDMMEGGANSDTAEVKGDNTSETFSITANGSRVRFERLGAIPFTLDIGTTENLVLNAGGGDDVITASGVIAGLVSVIVDAGAGNDTVNGSNAPDIILAGDGNDRVDGNDNNDTAFLGAGDDTFVWDPGDDNDTIEGQDGTDTLHFNGANAGETIDISANGGRIFFFRNIANVLMDMNDVERIRFNAVGGSDTVIVRDLSGTDVTEVIADLALATNPDAADGAADGVTVEGTAGNDLIKVAGGSGGVTVSGLSATVTVVHADALDTLVVNGQAGNDVFDATGLAPGPIKSTFQGGLGADVFLGGVSDEIFRGGAGNDTAFMGSGNDMFVWDVGDESDMILGQGGFDALLFNGDATNDSISIFASAGYAKFSRDAASVLTLDDLEHIEFNAAAGFDVINIGDLSTTDVTRVTVDLAAPGGGGDAMLDFVTVAGSASANAITVSRSGATLVVDGLSAQVRIDGADAATDQVVVFGGSGNDSINAKGLSGALGILTLNGGAGDDVLTASRGADVMEGSLGDDKYVYARGDGADSIINFVAGGTEDKIYLNSTIARSAAAALAIATQVGADTVLDFGGGDRLTLTNVNKFSLTADDFVADASVHNDFNANGQGDILFRHDDGSLVAWILGGGASFSTQTLGTVETAWKIAETGDFNRDSISDILWRHADGTVVAWFMNASGAVGATQTLGAPDNTWRIAETGDFNRDGRSDVLWRNTDGTVVTWLMNEVSGMVTQTVGNPGTAWHINATGDINGDGRDDIIWRHDDGSVVAWLMDETSAFATQSLGGPDGSWRIEDTGDFNADGRDDILWRNTDGTVVAWLMNGAGGLTTLSLGAPDASWQITDAGDLNGDARDDVLWRNSDGTVVAWLLDGNGGFASSALGAPEAAWRIQNDPTGIL